MLVEASGSKSGRTNNLVVVGVCLAMAGWFAYDGWLGEYRDEELAKNDGKPTANLKFNQVYGPITLGVIALIFLYLAAQASSRCLLADDQALRIDGKKSVAYDSVRFIDQRKFAKEGTFIVGYSDQGQDKEIKFSTRRYDNLENLLTELVKQTGAKPENAETDSEKG